MDLSYAPPSSEKLKFWMARLNSSVREMNTGLWNEMLTKAFEHFVQGPYDRLGDSQKNPAAIRAYGELLNPVKIQKLRLFGHALMSSD